MQTTLITGNTYPVKEEIKALGGRWDAEAKGWRVPSDKADDARKLVAKAGSSGSTSASRPKHFRCADCGAPSRGYYRCYDCSLEYRDGGSRARGGMSYYDRRGNFVLGDDD